MAGQPWSLSSRNLNHSIIKSPATPVCGERNGSRWVALKPANSTATSEELEAFQRMASYPAYDRDSTRLSISSTSSGFSSVSQTFSSESSPQSPTQSPLSLDVSLMGVSTLDMAVAKIEELDDEDELKKAPLLPSPIEGGASSVKRGRGRPRKHPLPPAGAVHKVTKGRSKTGCITCRRRKKKCDETKPECNNCVKNAVLCEGYPERAFWQSGKQKADITTPKNSISSVIRMSELPCLLDGVENRTDQVLLDHFVHNVSRILTLFSDDTNPFQGMLLPLAIQNRGLMHSLLCLAGSHLSNSKNFGAEFTTRQHHHFGLAMKFLQKDPVISGQKSIAADPTIAATLILCLNSICRGETSGEYRPHLDAAKTMLFSNSFTNSPFSQFLYEFFTYHDVINSVTILDRQPIMLMENYTLPAFIIQPDAGALLGVLDGLFGYMSKITLLRDAIRDRKARGEEPSVDYEMLSHAVAIDSEIREWIPAQIPGSHRYIAAQLYRQCTWVYLYRTIQPSCPSAKIKQAVEEGLEYLRHLPQDSGTQSILLMPLFMLGCAAFDPGQRPEISSRFQGLHEWSGLGNIVPAHKAVRRVWELMDSEDEELSWDWERIIQDMGYDFLVT